MADKTETELEKVARLRKALSTLVDQYIMEGRISLAKSIINLTAQLEDTPESMARLHDIIRSA